MGDLVRCTDCKFFRDLYIQTLRGCGEVPTVCSSCYPLDFEDERSTSIRVNFQNRVDMRKEV